MKLVLQILGAAVSILSMVIVIVVLFLSLCPGGDGDPEETLEPAAQADSGSDAGTTQESDG